ncbi:MAG: hypothetical protein ACNYPE_01220 [Candidatus Azotimanducaceae bacterium WSBS_2022_MAG_OTU7]
METVRLNEQEPYRYLRYVLTGITKDNEDKRRCYRATWI